MFQEGSNVTHRIGIMGGDGIGPEVVAEGLKVIDALGIEYERIDYDLGGERYLKDGTVLPQEIIDEWRGIDALYAGAVGTPDVPPGLIERGLLLKMRFELDLYINYRPFLGARTDDGGVSHDFVVIRENTEGTYAGEGGLLRANTPHEIATQGSVNTRMGVERCVRYAFDLAMKRSKHVTLVHKTNVLTFSGDLWERTFNEVAAEYPEVETAYNHVDAACIYFVQDPQRYDVIVTDNLFGDLLSDAAAMLTGSLGMLPSASLGAPMENGRPKALYEPVHGSAPDIAGQGKANPIACILSFAMALRYSFDQGAEAERLEKAIETVLADGVRTADLLGEEGVTPVSTSGMGDAILAALDASL
ncbi:3-isopropylmalate dehydrogenase [Salipiger sp.]|uniref:3-isopropylmalate dehydrogenase n=1 Tax=Salipiger sp. TaxID=2078585 RepID=UPI0035174471